MESLAAVTATPVELAYPMGDGLLSLKNVTLDVQTITMKSVAINNHNS